MQSNVFPYPFNGRRRLQRLESQTISDRERSKWFNELCKTCSRHRVIPKSVVVQDCLNDTSEIEYTGGSGNVSKTTYGGHKLAVKVARVHISNLEVVLAVSPPSPISLCSSL